MKIKASKYNEVRLEDVAEYIKAEWQIIKPTADINGVRCEVPTNGIILGHVYLADGSRVRMFSDYEVKIFNVQLPLAAGNNPPFAPGDDDYFDHEIEINEF